MSEEIIENNEQTVDQEPQTAETQSLVPGFKSICFRIGIMMIVVFAARIVSVRDGTCADRRVSY